MYIALDVNGTICFNNARFIEMYVGYREYLIHWEQSLPRHKI